MKAMGFRVCQESMSADQREARKQRPITAPRTTKAQELKAKATAFKACRELTSAEQRAVHPATHPAIHPPMRQECPACQVSISMECNPARRPIWRKRRRP